jgi:hypothetical protein
LRWSGTFIFENRRWQHCQLSGGHFGSKILPSKNPPGRLSVVCKSSANLLSVLAGLRIIRHRSALHSGFAWSWRAGASCISPGETHLLSGAIPGESFLH